MKALVFVLASVFALAQVPRPSPQSGGSGGGGGGTGTVTSVATACGVTGGTITTTGTVKGSQAVNAQTGTTDTIADDDCGKLVTETNAAAIAVTLPQANGSTFVAGWTTDIYCGGAGTCTITPTTSTINGAATLALTTGFSAHIVSDGTNYTAQLFSGYDPTKDGCVMNGGATSGSLAFCVANVAGTATTLIWPADSSSATTGYTLLLGAVATCPTLLPANVPTTCRFLTWGSAGGGTTVEKTGPYLTIGSTNYLAKTMYEVTTPPSYTNLNFGTGTTKTVSADGSVLLTVPTGTSGYNSITGGTFTTDSTIAMNCQLQDDSGGTKCAFLLRESGTAKVAVMRISFDYNSYIRTINGACYTADGATYSGSDFNPGLSTRPLNLDPSLFWFRVTKVSSVYHYWLSGDGINFQDIGTNNVTQCFTTGANQAGVGVQNGTTDYTQYVTVYSQVTN